MSGYTAPGAPPPIAPFPATFEFFKFWNQELAPSKEIPKEAESLPTSPMMSQALASTGLPPTSQAAEKAEGDETGAAGASTEPNDLEYGTEKQPSKSPVPASPKKNRMEANEPYFMDMLQQMRTCPGNSRVEHDSAKNTENHLVVIRGDQERARAAAQHEERRLIKSR